jgi:hypothetical protein
MTVHKRKLNPVFHGDGTENDGFATDITESKIQNKFENN